MGLLRVLLLACTVALSSGLAHRGVAREPAINCPLCKSFVMKKMGCITAPLPQSGISPCTLNSKLDCIDACEGIGFKCTEHKMDWLDHLLPGHKRFGGHTYFEECSRLTQVASRWGSVVKAWLRMGDKHIPQEERAEELCRFYLRSCLDGRVLHRNPLRTTARIARKFHVGLSAPSDTEAINTEMDEVRKELKRANSGMTLGTQGEKLRHVISQNIGWAMQTETKNGGVVSNAESGLGGKTDRPTTVLHISHLTEEDWAKCQTKWFTTRCLEDLERKYMKCDTFLDKAKAKSCRGAAELNVDADKWLRSRKVYGHPVAHVMADKTFAREMVDKLLKYGIVVVRQLKEEILDVPTEYEPMYRLNKFGGSYYFEVLDNQARTGLLTLHKSRMFGLTSAAKIAPDYVVRKMTQYSALAGAKYDDPDTMIEEVANYLVTFKPNLRDVYGLSDDLADRLMAGYDSGRIGQADLVALKELFPTYNQFFYRKLKSNRRNCLCYNDTPESCEGNCLQLTQIPDSWFKAQRVREHALDPARLVASPADCRLMAFSSPRTATAKEGGFWIKGKKFTMREIAPHLSPEEAQLFENGSMFIARLAPQDYHRFHFPVDAVVGQSYHYSGPLFSVSPIAVRSKHQTVLSENKRISTVLYNDLAGEVLYVSIGATMVGSVIFTSREGQHVAKGMEHGYMAFGGSTVAVFFQTAVTFRDEIVHNSERGIETIVSMGEYIGVMA